MRGCGIDDPRAQFLLRALPPPNLRRNQALAVQLQARLSALQWQACRTDPDEFFAACRDPQLRTLGAAWTRRDNLVYFPWRQAFLDYMESHDLRDQIRHLKEGLDEISCGYVDHFLKLAAYWERSDYAGSLWTDYDLRKRRQFIAFLKHFVQPCPELTELNPYYFFDNYGLADLPAPLRQGLAGKLIIDGGAYTGDTALAFRQHFPEAHIHAYEPGPVHATLSALLARGLGQGRITAYQQGLAAAATALAVRGCYGVRQAQCTTIDAAYAARRSAVGLIKLDTESCELEILRGARQVVAEDKPLLAVAMYHDPRDFFALREWLEEIRPDYRFMIRRSELSLPQADLVLVAY